MLAFRRILARRAPALRFLFNDSESSYSVFGKYAFAEWDDLDFDIRDSIDESVFYQFQASTIEDQIEKIKKREGELGALITIFQSTIRDKSNAVQRVLRNTKKEPLESITPNVKTMFEAHEAWAGLKDLPEINGYAKGTPDVSKILKALETWPPPQINGYTKGPPDVTKILEAMETWYILKKKFEDYSTSMRNVEGDLTLLASVRIMRECVNDVKKQLGNDEE